MFIYVLYILFSLGEPKTIWNKHYITWSVENGSNESFIDAAVQMWDIKPLKLVKVFPGNGDLKIFFKNLNTNSSNSSILLGLAYTPNDPQRGQINIEKS